MIFLIATASRLNATNAYNTQSLMRAASPASLSVRDHFANAWRLFKIHYRILIGSFAILFASWVSLEVAVVALQSWGVALNVVLHILFLLAFSSLSVGIHRMALQAVDGGVPTLSVLRNAFTGAFTYLLAILMYSAAVLAGLLLFILPGIYLAVRYALFLHVLASEDRTLSGAFREAALLSEHRWWALFRFFGVATILNIAGACLLGIGLLVAFPVLVLAGASMFRTLQREGARVRAADQP